MLAKRRLSNFHYRKLEAEIVNIIQFNVVEKGKQPLPHLLQNRCVTVKQLVLNKTRTIMPMDEILSQCQHMLTEHASTIVVSSGVFCVLSIINAAMTTISTDKREVKIILSFFYYSHTNNINRRDHLNLDLNGLC